MDRTMAEAKNLVKDPQWMKQLERAWNDKNSPIFMEKSWKALKQYCKIHGLDVSRTDLQTFLERRKSSGMQYDNYSKRKIAEISKEFVMRPKLFSQLHADIMYLTKKLRYKTGKKFVMVICDQLTRTVFLEALMTLKFDSQQQALLKIFEKIKKVYPDFKG